MPKGGFRLGAGRKRNEDPAPVTDIIAHLLQPETVKRYQASDRLTAVHVLQSNMEFYFLKAGEILATIDVLDKPNSLKEAKDQQIKALVALAHTLRMRDKAGEVAAQLIRYEERPMAPRPFSKDEDQPAAADGMPILVRVPSPPGVREILERAAQGLPPEPRKTL